jgi:hypothetical protein
MWGPAEPPHFRSAPPESKQERRPEIQSQPSPPPPRATQSCSNPNRHSTTQNEGPRPQTRTPAHRDQTATARKRFPLRNSVLASQPEHSKAVHEYRSSTLRSVRPTRQDPRRHIALPWRTGSPSRPAHGSGVRHRSRPVMVTGSGVEIGPRSVAGGQPGSLPWRWTPRCDPRSSPIRGPRPPRRNTEQRSEAAVGAAVRGASPRLRQPHWPESRSGTRHHRRVPTHPAGPTGKDVASDRHVGRSPGSFTGVCEAAISLHSRHPTKAWAAGDAVDRSAPDGATNFPSQDLRCNRFRAPDFLRIDARGRRTRRSRPDRRSRLAITSHAPRNVLPHLGPYPVQAHRPGPVPPPPAISGRRRAKAAPGPIPLRAWSGREPTDSAWHLLGCHRLSDGESPWPSPRAVPPSSRFHVACGSLRVSGIRSAFRSPVCELDRDVPPIEYDRAARWPDGIRSQAIGRYPSGGTAVSRLQELVVDRGPTPRRSGAYSTTAQSGNARPRSGHVGAGSRSGRGTDLIGGGGSTHAGPGRASPPGGAVSSILLGAPETQAVAPCRAWASNVGVGEWVHLPEGRPNPDRTRST